MGGSKKRRGSYRTVYEKMHNSCMDKNHNRELSLSRFFSMLIISIILSGILAAIVVHAEGEEGNSAVKTWYSVTDEEIKFCSRWGGTPEAQSGAVTDDTISLSQHTISLQAQVEEPFAGISGVQNISEKTYKVSWYVEPFERTISYSVKLIGPKGNEYVDSGSAARNSPGTGFYAVATQDEFTNARIDYSGHFLMVPIVKG